MFEALETRSMFSVDWTGGVAEASKVKAAAELQASESHGFTPEARLSTSTASGPGAGAPSDPATNQIAP